MVWIRAAAAMAGILMLAAPGQGGLRVEDTTGPERPLMPGLEVDAITVHVAADCTSVLLRTPGLADNVGLRVEAQAGPHVALGWAEVQSIDARVCRQGALESRTSVSVYVAPREDAPGMVPQPVSIRVSLGSHPADEADAQAHWNVTAKAVVAFTVEVAEVVVDAGGPAIPVAIQVANNGNTPATAAVSAASVMQAGARVDLTAPTAGVALGPGMRAPMPAEVTLPPGLALPAVLQLVVSVHADPDPLERGQSVVEVLLVAPDDGGEAARQVLWRAAAAVAGVGALVGLAVALVLRRLRA